MFETYLTVNNSVCSDSVSDSGLTSRSSRVESVKRYIWNIFNWEMMWSFGKLLLAFAVAFTSAATANAAVVFDRTIYYRNTPPDAAGHYRFEFQTTNGITTKAAGNENGAVGVVQYVSLEGIPVTFTYVADADGYRAEGEHIPAVPLHVLRQLEYIRTHPAVDEHRSRRW
ncbi:pupal cuticle protein Edg-78E [Drosophila pseudoobscura]|uniref:Pupal cuticle protein Edg-78E n=1 Tax=Drosophila pseudoobscura pseudoobscura TaxID=46245 RepID=A0A6I8V1Z3_DROPS|nr:pupal cuticle protein Edg-78E [Drosophila pseudoobscura]